MLWPPLDRIKWHWRLILHFLKRSFEVRRHLHLACRIADVAMVRRILNLTRDDLRKGNHRARRRCIMLPLWEVPWHAWLYLRLLR